MSDTFTMVAGVRVFDIKDQFSPKEIAFWVPPTPKKLIDPRPKVALAAKTADIFVAADGLMAVTFTAMAVTPVEGTPFTLVKPRSRVPFGPMGAVNPPVPVRVSSARSGTIGTNRDPEPLVK